MASQAAIAIENTRLVEAERRQRELAEALRESAEALNSTLNSEDVLDQILAAVTRLVPNDAACIIVLEGRWPCDSLERLYCPGQEEALHQMVLPLTQLKDLRKIVETGEPSVTSDTYNDPDWCDSQPQRGSVRMWAFPFAPRTYAGMLAADSSTPNFYTLNTPAVDGFHRASSDCS